MKGNYSQVSTTSEMKQSINIFQASENFGNAKDLLKLISFQVCALIPIIRLLSGNPTPTVSGCHAEMVTTVSLFRKQPVQEWFPDVSRRLIT